MFTIEKQRNRIPKQILLNGAAVASLQVGPQYFLYDEELSLIKSSTVKRHAEFSAGRACARLALSELGYSDSVIPSGKSRTPIWPNGVVGSLSHSDTVSVAVVAKQTKFKSLGIDIEPAVGLEESMWKLLSAPDEIPPPISDRHHAEHLRYSCKEAVYKCWFTVGGNRILNFDEVTLTFNDSSFTAYAPAPVEGCIHGKWVHAKDHYWALAWLENKLDDHYYYE